ncbi:MAG: hydrogenase expression/formation protein HypE [Spirochaetota bacterium]
MREHDAKVLLSHGGGGRAARDLVSGLIVRIFDNPVLRRMEDASPVELPREGRVFMTTDSFVVTPLFFPGGDIGRLAVCGTVNDLAAAGAAPAALSVGLILEEGFPLERLERVLVSMKQTADGVPVPLVTGDTKVVEKGRGDGLYVNTTGVGVVPPGVELSPSRIQQGDAVLINGPVGNHEAAVTACREGFPSGPGLRSDCAPLSGLVRAALEAVPELRCARDPTRGGVAAVLSEIVESRGLSLELDEEAIPVDREVQGLCELLGMDPLMMANEGKMLFFVPAPLAGRLLEALREHPGGEHSRVIGEVRGPGTRLTLRTTLGTTRIVTMPAGDQLPRIC